MPGTSNSGGRNKLSAETHVLKGTFRQDRHGDDATPAPPRGVPQPPVELTGYAADEWARMVERLSKNGTLSIVDDAALYQYVRLFAETEDLSDSSQHLRTVSRELMERSKSLTGTDLVDAIGRIAAIEHDWTRLSVKLRQNRMAIRAYLVEFGMTPAARTRVKTTGGGAESSMSLVDRFRKAKTGA